MTDRYQRARTDGHLDWGGGEVRWADFWDEVYDRARFHRGAKFQIVERPGGQEGPLVTLGELEDKLHNRLDGAKVDSIFNIRAGSDGWTLAVRRHQQEASKGHQIVENGLSWLGFSYSLGFHDCSGLTQMAYGKEGIDLPHKAGSSTIPSQLHDSDLIHISRADVQVGDLLFHWGNLSACDHVSIYAGKTGPGGAERVLDAEPHGVQGPAGWGYISEGIHYRPMQDGYYCDWAHVVTVGRSVAINGKP